MLKTGRGMTACILLIGLIAISAAAQTPQYLSPATLVATPAGDQIYVALATARRIDCIDTKTEAVLRRIELCCTPNALALSPCGAVLYAAVGGASGKLIAINTATGQQGWSCAMGHTPSAIAVSPDAKTLYVAKRFNNTIAVIDAPSGAMLAEIPMVREPVALALTPDGARLIVANHLPYEPADGAYVTAVVSIVDTAAKKVVSEIRLPNGSTGLRGIALSPCGCFAYVSHILARYHLPTTQLERGWMNTNALSIIKVKDGAFLNTVLLDDVDYGAANPWSVACTADGAFVCVTHAGTQEISVIDRPALHEKLTKVAAGEQVSEVSRSSDDVPNDLSFLVGLRRRIKLPGNGARGIALIGNTAWVTQYFTDDLGVAEITLDERQKAHGVALGEEQEMTAERKGEMFFNDARLCFQQWQSCASCHPDVRADALNWDLLNDGMGNPKNTKSLLLSHLTPPVMISGVRDKAETAVRAGIRYIQFAVRPEEDAEAIDAYLKTLETLPSPHLENGALNAAAERGKAVFDKAGCAACHPAPLFTNLQKYNIATGKDREVDWEFDTPTLCEIWRTGPYLHDGRAVTIEEVLKEYNVDDKHGVTSTLTEAELADLIEYVLSL